MSRYVVTSLHYPFHNNPNTLFLLRMKHPFLLQIGIYFDFFKFHLYAQSPILRFFCLFDSFLTFCFRFFAPSILITLLNHSPLNFTAFAAAGQSYILYPKFQIAFSPLRPSRIKSRLSRQNKRVNKDAEYSQLKY